MQGHSYDEPAAGGRDLQPHRPPEGISASDYGAIEDAVMETERGRWFLREYARRMRASETQSLRTALERIERMISLTHAPQDDAMANAQKQAQVCDSLEGICERLLDISWYMRERGFDGATCTAIEKEARHVGALVPMLQARAPDVDELPVSADAPPAPSSEADKDQAAAGSSFMAEPALAEATMTPAAPDASAESNVAPDAGADRAAVLPEQDDAPAQKMSAHEPSAPESAGLAGRMSVFAQIDGMPVRQKLALFV